MNDEELEKAKREHRRKAQESREAAMEHVEVLNLEQPLRRFLTDEELARMLELTVGMQRTLHQEGHEAGHLYVMATLRTALQNEQTRRDNMTEQARIALESNGHEAYLVRERNGGGPGIETWWGVCSCDHDTDDRESREKAAAALTAHLDEHGGGRWRLDLSD